MNPWSIILNGYPLLLSLLVLLAIVSDSVNRRAVNLLRAWKGRRGK
ncbi:hypothetical protein [Arthrobacter sp. P2b]|nr:hypothetical protein [Arthrobacter sp. P2b]